MANDYFCEPPRRANSKNPIFFFSRFLGLGHLQGLGLDSVGFWGSCQLSPFWGRGGVRPEGSIDPPPPGKRKPGLPCGPGQAKAAQYRSKCNALSRRARTPSPPLVRSLSKAARPGQFRTGPTAPMMRQFLCCAQAHTQCLQFCQKKYIPHGHTPNAFNSAKSNIFRMGTRPMPSVLPKVLNFAWAHAQCLQFCQK